MIFTALRSIRRQELRTLNPELYSTVTLCVILALPSNWAVAEQLDGRTVTWLEPVTDAQYQPTTP